MDNTFQGFVEYLTPANDVSKTDKPFHVAELGLRMEAPLNGRIMISHVSFQFTNDGARDIQQLNLNDQVRVQFGIRGNVTKDATKTGTEKNPDSKKCFISLEGYRFDILARAGQPSPQAVVNPAPVATAAPAQPSATPAPAEDDLPF